MPWYISSCAVVIIGIVLIYGAITDYKRRIIPNCVPITIMICGLFTSTPIVAKLFAFTAMVVILFIFMHTCKNKSGGGDLKLYCALSFSLGLTTTGVVLLAAIVLILAVLMVQKIQVHKSIEWTSRVPLCTYIAPAFWIVVIFPSIVRCF